MYLGIAHVQYLACYVPYITFSADLHGLLHWRSNLKKLPAILKGLQNISGDEIVKVCCEWTCLHQVIICFYYLFQFLADTFNALFSIIEEQKDEFGDLVFEALVGLPSTQQCCALY